jgi:DNA-binding NtrC family response regulator
MQALCRYSWPGNVRELQNVIERAVILAKSDTILDVERFLTGAVERPRLDLSLPFHSKNLSAKAARYGLRKSGGAPDTRLTRNTEAVR